MKKIIFILTLILSEFAPFSQSSAGLTSSVNLANRWSHAIEYNTYTFRHNLSMGFFYNFKWNDHSSLTMNFSFEFVKYRKMKESPSLTSKYYKSALLYTIPIYYNYTLDRISFLFGFQLAFGSGRGGEMGYPEYPDGSTTGPYDGGWLYRKIDFGPSVAISYKLSERFSLFASAYQGIIENSAAVNTHSYWTRFNFGFTYKPIRLFDGKSGSKKVVE
ncbi:MAG: hypothetical protein IPM74_11565 [Crocinitomicaceae bacterium]|nr:hypothetical protein [Crocinitomicaceae bacterium]MBK8926517.1 hypothetical protein [Crocinitomicaceae bacterium]